jgi:hypothetical protein
MLLVIKSKVNGYMRGGEFVSPYDRKTGVSGKLHRVPVRSSVFRWTGMPEKPILADYVRLAAKHPEYFKDARSALNHVEWVMEHPQIYLPATDTRYVMLIRRGSVDKCVVLDPTIRPGSSGYLVRSAYVMNKGQVDKYVAAAEVAGKSTLMRKSLSAGSLSPVVLGSPRKRGMFPRSLPMPHGMVQLSDVKFNPKILVLPLKVAA